MSISFLYTEEKVSLKLCPTLMFLKRLMQSSGVATHTHTHTERERESFKENTWHVYLKQISLGPWDVLCLGWKRRPGASLRRILRFSEWYFSISLHVGPVQRKLPKSTEVRWVLIHSVNQLLQRRTRLIALPHSEILDIGKGRGLRFCPGLCLVRRRC